ncbi:Glucan endo-1,3-beta-glucosidase A1 [Lachnellula cervina]|uniref:Glucan endo-1,3-beta-glucosidase A1 n=1 Tax=Lachnellula cervina TaxID=1316786 RepID=A0A7D8YP65_9HELO|nr:Glucan endo-1,3-beta-glucosidase A1 [Lachnellula cervina]
MAFTQGGAPNWGNNEHESYTQSRFNIHITQEQNLAITPRLQNGQWTSARIETRDASFAAAQGGRLLIEARIKLGDAPLEQQQGIWLAFWALGSRFRGNYRNWPTVTEWDFLEVVSGQSTMFSTIHCGYAPGGPCNEYNGLGNGGVPFSRGVFHSVGFLVDRSMCGEGKNGTWLDETLNWYLDGEKVFKITGATVGDEETWSLLAHEEHYLLLNVAVGGNWPGPPNNATIDGRSVGMEVEHIGVYNSV